MISILEKGRGVVATVVQNPVIIITPAAIANDALSVGIS